MPCNSHATKTESGNVYQRYAQVATVILCILPLIQFNNPILSILLILLILTLGTYLLMTGWLSSAGTQMPHWICCDATAPARRATVLVQGQYLSAGCTRDACSRMLWRPDEWGERPATVCLTERVCQRTTAVYAVVACSWKAACRRSDKRALRTTTPLLHLVLSISQVTDFGPPVFVLCWIHIWKVVSN